MDVSAETMQMMATIAPVLLLALVVDRRDVMAMATGRHARGWLWIIRGYAASLALTMVFAVPEADDGANGLGGFLVFVMFWIGVGGTMLILWNLLDRASKAANDERAPTLPVGKVGASAAVVLLDLADFVHELVGDERDEGGEVADEADHDAGASSK